MAGRAQIIHHRIVVDGLQGYRRPSLHAYLYYSPLQQTIPTGPFMYIPARFLSFEHSVICLMWFGNSFFDRTRREQQLMKHANPNNSGFSAACGRSTRDPRRLPAHDVFRMLNLGTKKATISMCIRGIFYSLVPGTRPGGSLMGLLPSHQSLFLLYFCIITYYSLFR